MIVPLLSVIIILVVLFHIFVYHEYNWPKYVKAVNKIPGPAGAFYFGSSLKFYKLKPEELLYDLLDGFKKWGSTYRLWYSGTPCVFVSDMTDIQTVLSSRQANSKGLMYTHLLPWLGSGLLTSSGQKWHTMRKIITPTFHFSILRDYTEIFSKNTITFLKILEKATDNDDYDLPKLVTRFTLDNVCETAMGISIKALESSGDNKYVRSIFRMGQIIVERIFSPILLKNASFACSSIGREHSQLLNVLHGFTYQIIDKKKYLKRYEYESVGKGSEEGHAKGDTKKKRSFLDILLESRRYYSLTSQEIREEVDTFMFEGHDTTAASINWTLFELGHHFEIQEQCYKELRSIWGSSYRSPTYEDLMDMAYLKRVIQEALRLYPSVPVISRKFNADIQLSHYLVPANTDIVLVLYAIHRNPEIYPDPDKFDPDRFLPELVMQRHPFSYIPFSAGQRNCVGQKFAMLEELTLLSSIIWHYKIESLNDRSSIKVVPEMILRPHTDLRFKLTKRPAFELESE